MATYGLRPKTWDGVTLPSFGDEEDFHFHFVEDSQILQSASAAAVQTQRPGLTPLRSYVQPEGMKYVMEVVIDTITQDNFDELKSMFNTIEGATHVLVCTDGNSVDRQIECTVAKWAEAQGLGNTVFKVAIDCPSAVWKATSLTTEEDDMDSEAFSLAVTNNGNTAAGLKLTLEPQDAVDPSNGYSKGKRIFLANRSEQPLTHFAAEGYAIEITGGGIDTTGLDVESDLKDLRVWLNSRELPRWLDSTTPAVATKVWCNIAMRPGKFTTLGSSIADDAETITGTFTGWPTRGWLYIDDEPVIYELVDDYTASITRLAEFAASHTAGDDVIWIEHVLTLTYGYSGASAPDAALDSKPVIDLSASSNTEHVWPGPFLNDNDRRSMTWRRIIEGEGSAHIRGWDDGDDMIFEDLLPVTGKPLADQVEVRFPVPAEGPFETDVEVGVSMRLHGYVADLAGNESLLIEEQAAGPLVAQSYSLDNTATRLRLKAGLAAVIGNYDLEEATGPLNLDQGTFGITLVDGETTELVEINGYAAIIFTLEEAVEISGFVTAFENSSSQEYAYLWTCSQNAVVDSLYFAITWDDVVEDELAQSTFPNKDARVTLEAGTYALMFNPDLTSTNLLKTGARNKTGIFAAKIVNPIDPLTLTEPVFAAQYFTAGDIRDRITTQFSFPALSPIFGVMSLKNDPQNDAPTKTGNAVAIDNVTVPLDADKAPLIVLSQEFDLFPLIGTVTGESGDQVALTFMCKAGQGIELDFESGDVTDLETGLPANYAVEYSNPTKRLQVLSGLNGIQIDLAGASATELVTATAEFRDTWL